jgi:hypothetical protein
MNHVGRQTVLSKPFRVVGNFSAIAAFVIVVKGDRRKESLLAKTYYFYMIARLEDCDKKNKIGKLGPNRRRPLLCDTLPPLPPPSLPPPPPPHRYD